MVDNLHNLGILDACCRLAYLVVIDQDHLTVRMHGDIGAGDDSDRHICIIEHDCLAKRLVHEIDNSLVESPVLVERENPLLHNCVNRLIERGDEVCCHRHLACTLRFEHVRCRDIAVSDHACGDEPLVRTVIIGHNEGLDVMFAQNPTSLDDFRIRPDADGVVRHHI